MQAQNDSDAEMAGMGAGGGAGGGSFQPESVVASGAVGGKVNTKEKHSEDAVEFICVETHPKSQARNSNMKRKVSEGGDGETQSAGQTNSQKKLRKDESAGGYGGISTDNGADGTTDAHESGKEQPRIINESAQAEGGAKSSAAADRNDDDDLVYANIIVIGLDRAISKCEQQIARCKAAPGWEQSPKHTAEINRNNTVLKVLHDELFEVDKDIKTYISQNPKNPSLLDKYKDGIPYICSQYEEERAKKLVEGATPLLQKLREEDNSFENRQKIYLDVLFQMDVKPLPGAVQVDPAVIVEQCLITHYTLKALKFETIFFDGGIYLEVPEAGYKSIKHKRVPRTRKNVECFLIESKDIDKERKVNSCKNFLFQNSNDAFATGSRKPLHHPTQLRSRHRSGWQHIGGR